MFAMGHAITIAVGVASKMVEEGIADIVRVETGILSFKKKDQTTTLFFFCFRFKGAY